MLRTTMTAILCGLYLASSGFAAVDIEEWSGASSGFTIHGEQYIEITAAGTYYFQSYDGASPADIDNIYITGGGVTGTVTIHIYQDPNDGEGPGAAAVKDIDLSTATTGVLGKVYISGHLGEDDDVVVHEVSDDIEIGGNVYNTFNAGEVDSEVSITIEKDLEGTLKADTLGNLTIEGEFAGVAVPGDIVIAQDYAGTLAINNRYSGTITLGDPNDPNDPNKAADLSGTISTGIFLSDAQIHVTGDVDSAGLHG